MLPSISTPVAVIVVITYFVNTSWYEICFATCVHNDTVFTKSKQQVLCQYILEQVK